MQCLGSEPKPTVCPPENVVAVRTTTTLLGSIGRTFCSGTILIKPYRTKWAHISAASSLPTIVVKSHNQSIPADAKKV